VLQLGRFFVALYDRNNAPTHQENCPIADVIDYYKGLAVMVVKFGGVYVIWKD